MKSYLVETMNRVVLVYAKNEVNALLAVGQVFGMQPLKVETNLFLTESDYNDSLLVKDVKWYATIYY